MKLLTLLSVCLLVTTGTWAYSRDSSKKASTTSETAHMLCNVLVHASSELLTDHSINVDSIKEYLRQDCTKLPNQKDLVQQCQLAVDIYLGDILRHISSGTELSKICSIIQGHDTTDVFIPKPKVAGLTSNTTCVLCEFIVHILQTFASANTSAQELAHILEGICNEMPTVLRAECKSFVDTYGVDMIALLVREFDPAKVCQLLKVCQKSQNVAFLTKPNPNLCGLCDYVSTYLSAGHPIENVCNHFSSDNSLKQQCETLVHLFKPNFCSQLPLCYDDDAIIQPLEQSIESPIKSAECSLCKYVISYVDAVIQNNKSEAAIEAALEKVCGILPAAIKPACISFVDSYGPLLVQLIAKYGTPELVCNALQMCHNGTQTHTSIENALNMKLDNLTLRTIPCLICKYVIGYLETATQGNKSAAAIEAALDKVCNLIPGPLKNNCTAFVHKYGPIIAFLFAKNETAQQICDFIKVCNNGTQTHTSIQNALNTKLDNLSLRTIPCLICKYVIGYLETATQGNKSAAAVEAALDKVCNLIPGPLKDNCTAFVHKYGPIIALLFAKNETAQQICDFIKVCNNGTQTTMPFDADQVSNIKPSSVNSVQCALCKYVVGYVDAVIQNNKSEAAIEAALEKVCGILPASIKPSCISFVDSYGPILVQLIAKYGTPELVCNALKMCHNGTQEMESVKPTDIVNSISSKLASPQCSLCKYVISYVDAVIQNNKSEAAIEAALEKVCSILPAPIKSSCVTFVDSYGPILVQLIAKYGTPDLVCNALKMCHNGTQEVESIKPAEIIKSISSKLTSPQCSLCKYVISYVDAVIQNNKSEAAIEAALEKVCSILPAPIKSSCVTFVDSYGPILVQLIAKYGTPDLVCNALKMCHNGTQEITPLVGGLKQMLKNKQPTVNSLECSLCKYIVSYIDNVIQNNKSEAAIEAALEKVCTILPPALKSKCDQFVVTYGPVLVQLIQKYGTPELVCNALQLCHNGTESVRPTTKNFGRLLKSASRSINVASKLASPQCSLCKYVISYVDAVIQTNKSEAAIEAALEKVCSILPAPIKSSCVTFVDSYGPILVQLIAKYGTPDLVCNALKVCHNGTQATESISHTIVKSIKKVKSGSECTLCKYILSYVNLLIQANATEADLEKALEIVCSILPKAYHDKCDVFVRTYSPILVELIAELDDPNVICAWLDVCPKSDDKFIQIPAIKTSKVKGLPCNLCEYIVNYLDAVIQSNTTETKFEEALDKACKVLPMEKLQAECKTLVHLYGGDLIKFAVEYGDPKVVCQALGLCDK